MHYVDTEKKYLQSIEEEQVGVIKELSHQKKKPTQSHPNLFIESGTRETEKKVKIYF